MTEKAKVSIDVHPAALLFPMMADDELNKLADDIAANGLIEPIVIYQGQLLDGRNRLAACELADVEPRFTEVDIGSGSPTLYAASKNFHRRHLTPSQRGAIGAEITLLIRDEAKARQLSGLKNQCSSVSEDTNEKGRSRAIAAKAVQSSEATVQRALDVKQADSALFEKVKAGEVTVTAAKGRIAGKSSRESHDDIAYEPKTDHQKKLANGQKERMVRGLSVITGICRGLAEANVRKIVAVCDQEELKTWIERAQDLSTQLRAFAARLKKGN